jgi:hypothetical protein
MPSKSKKLLNRSVKILLHDIGCDRAATNSSFIDIDAREAIKEMITFEPFVHHITVKQEEKVNVSFIKNHEKYFFINYI